MDIRQDFRSSVGQLLKESEGLGKEADIVVCVDGENGLKPSVGGTRALKAEFLQRGDERLGAIGILKRRDDAAVDHVLGGLVVELLVVEEEEHLCRLR